MQQVALLACQKGRPKTTEVTWVPENQGCLRPSRHGDLRPQYHGIHLTHQRWFKQLCRLEAYTRNVQSSDSPTPSKLIHQTRVWRTILGAAGFPGGFKMWWACRPRHLPEIPYDLPDSPIFAASASSLWMAFELEVRSLEAILQKEMAAKVRAAHKDNPNKVFKDIQKPKVQPVQMLKDQLPPA